MKWNYEWVQEEANDAMDMKDPLAIFKEEQPSTEIRPDMSPEEVANIWSDRLMKLISHQMGIVEKTS